jgi:acetoin:2,6-dichlorophenolindophenol oxidoreductase subunit alpha
METKGDLFKSLLMARVFEEKKIELAKEITTTDIAPASCYGQEAIPVGVCYGLEKEDYILPSIRSSWIAFITKGLPLKRLTAEMYGKVSGISKSRELSTHITHLELGILGGTGILASTATVAAGIGLALKYRKTNQVAVCFLGDGASNREEFFTGINFAALKKLPTLYVIENNQIAEYTPYKKFMPIKNIADRALAFGIPGIIVDGNDVMAVYETAQKAIKRARAGQGPTLIECKTCRVRAMMEGKDPKKGLPEKVIAAWKKKDPVKRMKEHMIKIGALTEGEFKELKRQLEGQVDEAFASAREGEYPSSDEVFRDVYAEGGQIE